MNKNKTTAERIEESIGKKIEVEIPLKVKMKIQEASILSTKEYRLMAKLLNKNEIDAHIQRMIAESIQELTGQSVVTMADWQEVVIPETFYLAK